VEGITGTAQSGGSGSGIYNQGAGGTIIANNIIRNCCINTTAFSLIPAGIDLNLDAAMMPVQVIGNHVSDIANGSAGISVTTGPANIVGNTVVQSTGMVTAVGIYLNSASNVSATDNHVTIATSIASSTGIFSYTNGASSSNVKISDNTVKGASAYSIRVDQTGGTTTTNVVVDGNQISGGSSACIGLGLYSIINGAVNGNAVSATTVAALDLSACTFTRFSGNTLITTGTTGVNTQGTCTNSFFDQSNTFSGNAVNAATGLIVERRSSAVPSAGTAAVGDTWLQTAPTAATSPGGMCVTAGSPGTWKGFAALAA
jgi:hypothetical protein